VNQQLLSGFGFATNRRFLQVTETNRHAAREAFRQQVITALTAAQNAYWDLVAAQERVRASEQALQVSQTLYDNNRKQAQIGTLAPLEVVASESEVAARRRDLIVAQTNEQVAELRLKNTMSRQMDDALAAAQIAPSDALPEPQDADIPAFDEALATAMRNRPELQQAQDGIRNQQVAVDYSAKKLKPTLSVFAMLTSAGREADLFGAWRQVGALDFPEYAYGFSLSFTIGNRAAQADNLRARMELRQSETSLQRTRNQIRLEVRNAIIGLQQAHAQVAAASRAVAANQQTLDAEQKKLQAGTSTPYNVIRVERDLYSAQLAEVQARVSYAKALVEMDRATGVTVEEAGLHLDELLAGSSANSSQESQSSPVAN
jgi:outer membrane protein TolC